MLKISSWMSSTAAIAALTAGISLLPGRYAFANGPTPPSAPVTASTTPAAPAAPRLPLLIKDITIIDGTGKAPYTASVLVEDDKISKIITGDLVPVSQATVIDGKGKFLIPGFVDTLAHVSLRSHMSASFKDFDSGELDDLFRDVQEKDAQKRLANYKTILKYNLKMGTTTFVDSITSVADSMMLRDAIAGKDYPNFYTLGPILSYKGGHPYPTDSTVNPKDPNAGWKYWIPQTTGLSAEDRTAAMSIMRSELTKLMRDGGLAGLKVDVDSPPENGVTVPRVPYETLQVICDVAKQFQKPVFFLSSTDQGIQDAVRAGATVKLGAPWIFNSNGTPSAIVAPQTSTLQSLAQAHTKILSLESTEGGNVAAYLKSKFAFDQEAFINPTIPQDTRDNYDKFITQFGDPQDKDPEHAVVAKNVEGRLAMEDLVHGLLAQVHQTYKLSVIPTGDEGSAWVFHGNLPREMSLLSGRGAQGSTTAVMTSAEIISSATLGAATAMNLQSTIGSIEVGKQADMLLLKANPLDDITNVRKIDTVIKSGKVIDFLKSDD